MVNVIKSCDLCEDKLTDNDKKDRHLSACKFRSLFNCKANQVIASHFVGLEPVADVDSARIALNESPCQRRA